MAYATGTGTITLIPSGFVMGQCYYYDYYFYECPTIDTTTLSADSPIYVAAVPLDPTTLNAYFVYPRQPLRPGLPTVNVDVTSSDQAVGTITTSPLAFSTNESSHFTYFDPQTAGTTVLSITQPPGFSTPSNFHTITANVMEPQPPPPPNLYLSGVVVGKYLQTSTQVYLQGPASSGGVEVAIAVVNPSVAVLSSSSIISGTASLTLNIAAGESRSPAFFVQSIGDTNSTSFTASAPGYVSSTNSITITPSGFAISDAYGSFWTTTGAADTTLTVVPARLDQQTLNLAEVQQLRPGMSNTRVTITSSRPEIGTITLPEVVFSGADNPNYMATSFHPVTPGATVIRVHAAGPGFSDTSNYNNITANVTASPTWLE